MKTAANPVAKAITRPTIMFSTKELSDVWADCRHFSSLTEYTVACVKLEKRRLLTLKWKMYTIISLYHFFEDSDIFISFFNG
jgi:hypothetical protein